MEAFLIITGSIGFMLALLMCVQESRTRKINVVAAIVVCIVLTPLFGYFVISSFAKRNAPGCTKNEAGYCGLCNKNILGEIRPGARVL